jgi:hypothetical protein
MKAWIEDSPEDVSDYDVDDSRTAAEECFEERWVELGMPDVTRVIVQLPDGETAIYDVEIELSASAYEVGP